MNLHAISDRWWLPVGGLVVGAIIGLLVSAGGGKQWTAKREIYLGNPLENGTALTSAPTSLGLASTYATSLYALRHAASASGLPVSRLSGNVSAKPIPGPTGTAQTQPAPLLLLSVTTASAAQADRAANYLASLVVSQFQPFTRTKLQIAKARLAQEQIQIGDINRRLTQALNAQATLARSAANQPLVSEYTQISATLATERSMLDNDITAYKTLISQTKSVEAPRILSATRSASTSSTSRASSVLTGALIGLLLGLLAATFWQPTANSRHAESSPRHH